LSCAQEKRGALGKNDRLSNTKKLIPSDLIINDDCLSNDPAYSGADILTSLEDVALEMTGVSVSAAEVNEFGDEAISQMKNSGEFKFIENGIELSALNIMLKELTSAIKDPTGINYEIHLIDDDKVNAYTVGGHIIITTEIIKKANSESTVAFIIGHEIGHNEKGHLEKTIKKIKVANDFFDGSGDIGIILQNMITPAFNQPIEVEADYYGVDLCYAAGYDPRKGIDFWEKLSKEEHKNLEGSFLRSHPYSADRANCMRSYLKTNYSLN
jgi:predicted Zn-dependent protease